MNQVVTGSLTTGVTNDAEASADLLESASPGSEAVNAPSTDPEESILARYFGIVLSTPTNWTRDDPKRGYYLRKQAIATNLERR